MGKHRSFYTESKDRLFAYLMRMTGDYERSSDILQEAFARYLEHYRNRDTNISLLYTIARNIVFDEKRRKDRRDRIEEEPSEYGNDQERRLLVREEYRRVLDCIQRLCSSERDILALVISSDLTYREVASITGISEANVKIKVHRARLKLRKMLKEDEDDG